MKSFLLEDFEDDFELIGLQTRWRKCYQLAYFLNQQYHTRFQRTFDLDVQIKGITCFFTNYHWKNKEDQTDVYLIENVSHPVISNNQSSIDLFSDVAKNFQLIEGKHQFNYFIKLNSTHSEFNFLPLLDKINIIRIEHLNQDKIKNIDRLIF